MKGKALGLLAALCLTQGAARADMVHFDFDALPFLAPDIAISSYMTSTYGSAVVLSEDAMIGRGFGFGGDSYVTLDFINDGAIQMFFIGQPITGIQFEGHVFDATPHSDFKFRAYDGHDLVSSFKRNCGIESFNSGWIEFDRPVNRLMFSDSGVYDIGIDDLTVERAVSAPVAIPAPGAAFLAVMGLGLLGIRRK